MTIPDSQPLQPATLEWRDAAPLSTAYGDMYFNLEQGVAESEFVFLQGNDLAARFRAAAPALFTVAETGFGTGLNFLCCRRLWLQQAPPGRQLHYISVEKHPLQPADLQRALSAWPGFADGATQLIAQYPMAVSGFHRLLFDQGRISLTLLFGDAQSSYAELDARVDAWFLDGFAPAKNPAMWQQGLFEQMARLSRPGTTLATFTAAGFVRRGLQQAGFSVHKAPGFGRKRERLVGRLAQARPGRDPQPWFKRPAARPVQAVLVVGAGLAGCSTAAALARRGLRVTLLDQADEVASAGSGNRQGALYAKLPVQWTAQGRIHLSGLLHSLRQLEQQDPARRLWSDCGLLQLACDEKEQRRQQALLAHGCYPAAVVTGVDAARASALAGSPLRHGGLFFPRAGWVAPKAYCQQLVADSGIELRLGQQLDALRYDAQGQQWQARLSDGSVLRYSQVVLCTAAAANRFDQTRWLRLKPIRGQVSIAEQPMPADNPLKTVVCAAGYVSPARAGHYCFGATFDLHDQDPEIRPQDHQVNLDNLAAAVPDLAAALAQQTLAGRVGFRCATPDYLPLIGPAPVYEGFLADYGKLRDDRRWPFPDQAPAYHPGLYLNTGHGSKGLVTCPIGAELLAAQLCGEPLPLEKSLVAALSPARFIIKQLIKKAI